MRADHPATPKIGATREPPAAAGRHGGTGLRSARDRRRAPAGRPRRDVPAHATTIEGIGEGQALHPVQQAFIDHQAAQCGYCSNGIVMAADAMLDRVPDRTEQEIRAALERNLCRCGAHARVLRAIRSAAAAMTRSRKS
ncbi:MAG: (2Fe-2S)-binding protein [Betaproteobacteria bacterium]